MTAQILSWQQGGTPCLCGGAAPLTPSAGSLFDDFSAYSPRNSCLANATVLGPWTVLWGSVADGGCTRLTSDPYPFTAASAAELKPAAAANSGQTFSAVLNGPSYTGTFSFSVKLRTLAQLRTGSAPNNWEVAWIFWDFAFPHPAGTGTDGYYYTIKETGTEFGRLNDGAQSILATTSHNLNPAVWHQVYVSQVVSASQVVNTVYADGAMDLSYADSSASRLSSGQLACYCEDSQVQFTQFCVPGPVVPWQCTLCGASMQLTTRGA